MIFAYLLRSREISLAFLPEMLRDLFYDTVDKHIKFWSYILRENHFKNNFNLSVEDLTKTDYGKLQVWAFPFLLLYPLYFNYDG